MKNRLLNLLSLLPSLLAGYVLLNNYLFYQHLITPGIDQVIGNNTVSGDIFTLLHYGFIGGIVFSGISAVGLGILAWKDKLRALVIVGAVVATLLLFILGNVIAISDSLFAGF